jgi:type II secretory pathway pseudopilin PulG
MVAGVIAVVGAIAVPIFLKARLQRKLSQERVSLRTVSQALASYAIDWNADPPDLSFLTRQIVFNPPVRWGRSGHIIRRNISRMAHSSIILEIPFERGREYEYGSQ